MRIKRSFAKSGLWRRFRPRLRALEEVLRFLAFCTAKIRSELLCLEEELLVLLWADADRPWEVLPAVLRLFPARLPDWLFLFLFISLIVSHL